MQSDAGTKETQMNFECHVCGLTERYEYFGTDPPFTKPIKFKEAVFVTKDPFSPPNATVATNYLLLGATCSLCRESVCVDQLSCSIYYGTRYCVRCVAAIQSQFPSEVQKEIIQMISNAKKNDECKEEKIAAFLSS